MRASNHLMIKKKCESVLSLLFKKHNLGRVKSICVDTEGWVNPCFFINGEYAVRFNARDPHLPKFQREKIIFDLLKYQALPVPQQVILDDSKSEIEYDILISSFLPGRNLGAEWDSLHEKSQQGLAFAAGELLNKIHEVQFDFFGEIAGRGPLSQEQTWSDYLIKKLKFHIQESMTLALLTRQQSEKILAIFEHYVPLLDEVKSPQLIHVDYHYGNLLFLENKVSGVLDFEWSLAGDPLYDMGAWSGKDEKSQMSQKHFLKGYDFSKLSESEDNRIELYQMIKNIELCPVAKLYFGESEAKEYLQTTLTQINYLYNKTN